MAGTLEIAEDWDIRPNPEHLKTRPERFATWIVYSSRVLDGVDKMRVPIELFDMGIAAMSIRHPGVKVVTKWGIETWIPENWYED